MKKRFLALFLCLVMALGCVPAMAATFNASALTNSPLYVGMSNGEYLLSCDQTFASKSTMLTWMASVNRSGGMSWAPVVIVMNSDNKRILRFSFTVDGTEYVCTPGSEVIENGISVYFMGPECEPLFKALKQANEATLTTYFSVGKTEVDLKGRDYTSGAKGFADAMIDSGVLDIMKANEESYSAAAYFQKFEVVPVAEASSLAEQIWQEMAEAGGIKTGQRDTSEMYATIYPFGDTKPFECVMGSPADGYLTMSSTADGQKLKGSVTWRMYPAFDYEKIDRYFTMLSVLIEKVTGEQTSWVGSAHDTLTMYLAGGDDFEMSEQFGSLTVTVKYSWEYDELYCLIEPTANTDVFVME